MLDLPPKNFAPKGLPCVTVDAAILFRISRYGSGEPYFGCSLSNRFDSPSEIPEERFKTCYTALSLEAAFAETVLHDEELIDGNFFIAETALTSRYVIHFAGAPLKIANLTGAALKTLGGNGALSTIKP